MFAQVDSAALIGLTANTINVEIDITRGTPQILIVGLPDTAVNEARERVKSAIRASGYELPLGRIVINMAPADLRKEGAYYDLPIALGILISSGQIKSLTEEYNNNFWLIGELSLNGELRSINGALAIADSAQKSGIKNIILPKHNAREASLIDNINIYGAETLNDVIEILYKPESRDKYYFETYDFLEANTINYIHDLKYVKGQYQAKRALEIAAAGGHNILFVGEPGSGKSMLANCLPSIMPPLSKEESLEVTKIYSVAGLLQNNLENIITHRPFRAPHHSVSGAGLIGGGSYPKPGEISLAHRGVLFLDELAEFDKKALDQLRQPIESQTVSISRVRFTITYPCNFLLIAACNPNTGTRKINTNNLIISAPLWDRFGLIVWVPSLKSNDLLDFDPESQISSADIRFKVMRAWNRQQERYNYTGKNNAKMTSSDINKYCILTENAQRLLEYAVRELDLTGRTYDHVLRVSRTIADLDLSDEIDEEHIAEAIHYRISQQSILTQATR